MQVTLGVVQWVLFLVGLFVGWWWLLLPVTVWLVYSYGLLLPVGVAVLVDGYFNAWAELPYLTLSVITLGIVVVVARPYFYTT